MTFDEYDTLFTTIVAACNQFDEHAWYIPSDEWREVMAKDQQLLIHVGNTIEQYGYSDAPVIHVLEEMCEDMYQQMNGPMELRIEMLKKLRLDLSKALHELRVFVPGHALSVVAIVKNEAKDMKEWIEFHRLVGVSHFYIYDNESEDDLKEVLRPYIESGIVTYIWWPGSEQQMLAYTDAVERFRNETRLMAVIDADEYLLPTEDRDLLDVIDEIYALDFRSGCVGVNWREYGCAGLETRTDALLTESHFYRAEDAFKKNAHVKAVCNPRKVERFLNPHFPIMKENALMITEAGTMFFLSYCYESNCEKLRINHYYIKSKEEFFEKAKRGWPDQANYEKKEADIEYNYRLYSSELNAVYDPIMERYLPKLRDRMQGER